LCIDELCCGSRHVIPDEAAGYSYAIASAANVRIRLKFGAKIVDTTGHKASTIRARFCQQATVDREL
jgi:hypothetical protein